MGHTSGRGFILGQLQRDLAGIVGHEHVTLEEAATQAAGADWSWPSKYLQHRGLAVPGPDAVVSPANAEEVALVVQLANDYRLPVIARGGGTGTQGGTLAPYGGICLDVSRLDEIFEIDEVSLVATVGAGVIGPDLEAKLNERGLTLSHYPGSYHLGATIGGYVAARGSGVTSTKYGKAEDQVLQVEAVVPPGKLIETLPVRNHAAGPDLLQLLTGSEGTLGVITRLAMRLDPLPEARGFLSFEFSDIFAGIEAGRRIMASRLRPSVIRLYDAADSVKLREWVGTDLTGNLMIIMVDGGQGQVDADIERITEIAVGAGGVDHGPDAAETWWTNKYEPYAKGKLPAPPLMYGTFDTVARFKDLPNIYRAKKRIIEEEFADVGARYTAHLSHWFDWGAMFYDRFYVDEPPQDPEAALALHDRLWNAGIQETLANGGALNDHHGVGLKLSRFMRAQYGPAFDVLKAVKDGIDPLGIMNPGKLGFGAPAVGINLSHH